MQLYALRSARNWGIGDFTDLRHAGEPWAARGAGIVGVNPLHALFPQCPAHASPYSPSSRLFLNVLYLDVEAIADFARVRRRHGRSSRPLPSRQRCIACAARELVDYAGVAAAQTPRAGIASTPISAARISPAETRVRTRFAAFARARRGAAPSRAVRGAAGAFLHAPIRRAGAGRRGRSVSRSRIARPSRSFADAHAERVEFYEYLQWQADLQLDAVAKRVGTARASAIGLYADLAVSIDGGGAEAWANQGSTPPAPASARRPTSSTCAGRTGGCRRWFPRACARPATRRSSPRCARTCATPARCASTT